MADLGTAIRNHGGFGDAAIKDAFYMLENRVTVLEREGKTSRVYRERLLYTGDGTALIDVDLLMGIVEGTHTLRRCKRVGGLTRGYELEIEKHVPVDKEDD